MIVLDTCALLYYTLNPEKLSQTAVKRINVEERLIINSISLWEIGIKNKNGKLKLPLPIREYVSLIQKIEGLSIMAVTEMIWLKNIELDWAHRDPADRTIVATAILEKCSLLTSDKKILDFYSKAIW